MMRDVFFRGRCFTAAPLVVLLSTLSFASWAAPVTPPIAPPVAHPQATATAPPGSADADDLPLPTATAVLVKSWSGCSSNEVVWALLNSNWSQYGDVRIRIDYRNRALCDGDSTITYDALEASGAQTVILSDVGGGTHQLAPSEIDALVRYVEQGHNVIATYVTLQYGDIDNRGLAPLFGLDPTAMYGLRGMAPGDYFTRPHAPLFDGLEGQYETGGYLSSQKPPGNRWTNAAAGQGRILGFAFDRKAAVIQYCGAGFRALLFTQMPEYHDGSAQDQQVLYNALVMGRKPGCRNE